MNLRVDDVWKKLLQAGIVHGEVPEERIIESPWFVKVLLAFSGWLAAVFLLFFLGMGLEFVFDSSVASFVVGGIMIGGAFVILRLPRNEFFEHLALAVSVAGQALVVYGMFNVAESAHGMVWVFVGLFQASLAIVLPNYVHRVLSSFMGVLAFSAAFTSMGAPFVVSGFVMLLAAWFWLNEFRYTNYLDTVQPIGYGLTLSLISLKGTALFSHGRLFWMSSRDYPEIWVKPWMAEAFPGLAMFYIVLQILKRSRQSVASDVSIACLVFTFLISIASIEASGITVGLALILLGFSGGNRVLFVLGIVSLLFYISSYYYSLEITLLAKSKALFVIGLLLLLARAAMNRFLVNGKEVVDAD